MKRKSLPFVKINSSKLTIPPVTVSAMSPGSAEVMPYRIQSKTGYRSVTVDYVLGKVRDIAKRYRMIPWSNEPLPRSSSTPRTSIRAWLLPKPH